jgi:guanine deaminase
MHVRSTEEDAIMTCNDPSHRHGITRKGLFRGLAAALGGLAAGVAGGRQALAATPAEANFCYPYNPETTKMTAIPWGKPYEGEPALLKDRPMFGYVQEWNGNDPKCTLEPETLCKSFPSHAHNIKAVGVYDGIEAEGNQWMRMASDEARTSVESGGGPFGAVILQIDDETNEVIRYWRNHNHVPEWRDPTAHAEVSAIRAACRELGVFSLGEIKKSESKLPQTGATSHCVIYSSAEPCPMCYSAIYWARIPKLVFAATRYDAAVQGVNFSDEALYLELAQPYHERKGVKALQASVPNSLDAFNLWKRSKKIQY